MQSSPTPNRPVLKELKCPNCNSPIQQHIPDAQTLVCTNCGSYVSVGAETPSLLEKGAHFPKSPVPVKIGERFKLDNVEYFVLGRVMYRGWDPTDTSDSWVWNEWQLGATDGQILWLSYDNEDGFVIYKKLRLREQFDPHKSRAIPVGGGKQVPVHERYPAQIVGAEGELTFQARRQDKVFMVEGAAAGKKYSLQATDQEIELYEGSRIQETALAEALNDQDWLQKITARAENKKTRDYIGVICLVFAVIGLILAGLSSQMGEVIFDNVLTVNTQNPIASLPVELNQAGRPTNIWVQLQSGLTVNTYIDADVSVISPNEKKTLVFSQDFYYETGVEDGEAWTETRKDVGDMFVPFQSGTHYIEVALGGTGFTNDVNVRVEIQTNRVVSGWFLGYAVLSGIVGLALLFSGGGISSKTMLIIAAPIILVVILLALGVSLEDMLSFVFDILEEA